MSVCKDCEVRTVGCHAKYEGYIKFREDREKKCEARNKARQIDMYMRDHRGLHYAGMRLPQYV